MSVFVCKGCGYNAPGHAPDFCPHCGMRARGFLSAEMASEIYAVQEEWVSGEVYRLRSEPRLGVSAYRIDTPQGRVWIDCPPVMDAELAVPQSILFTHRDFLGAAQQYQAQHGTQLWLHQADATHPLVTGTSIDQPFDGDFVWQGIEAFHLGGHTPGFTLYLYKDLLFACDYVFGVDAEMKLNAFGNRHAIRAGAERILAVTAGRRIRKVCGYNYVTDFRRWRSNLQRLLKALPEPVRRAG